MAVRQHEENVASSEHAYFEERDEVMELLRDKIACAEPDDAALESNVEQVMKILEKYQEQSSLLDPHLEGLMEVLTARSRILMLDTYERQRAAHERGEDHGFIFQCERNPQQHAIFTVVYNLCRCRGSKTVVKFFPHEVGDLEPLMFTLQSQDRDDHARWETRYSLLLWLSMVVLIPFDIYTIDSSMGTGDSASSYGAEQHGSDLGGADCDQTLVGSILALCREYMTDSGPTRDAAAVCLSSLLTRPDMDESYFLEFVAWAGALLSDSEVFRTSQKTFLVTGVLMTLTDIFKKGHRHHLLGVIEHLFPHVRHLASTPAGTSSTLLRKLLVKLFQRMGMAFLPPRTVSWAYQRGQRSLLQNLAGSAPEMALAGGGGGTAGGSSASAVAGSLSAGGGAAEAKGGTKACGEEEDVWVPDEVEDIVEQLLVGLRDRDTVVRWSAAKGVGRITSRLPQDLADEVVASVFELFSASEGDGAWHGGCLALAELSRRGLLLPFRLPEAVPVVVKAIHFDVRRGSNSVGAHVRDAACYVCWAFARAYSAEVMRPHVHGLCQGMLLAALFDREINCRRAAAAAFQENVGRQGHENFPHGIEILTAADYFTLGVRSNAYLNIALTVASYPEYTAPLLRHLFEVKLFHWDRDVRELSAEALGRLTALDPVLVATTAVPSLLPYTTSPDLLKRHGSVLGLAEALAALAALTPEASEAAAPLPLFDGDVVAQVVAVVPQIEKARLYRGRGGEIVRQACCRLIECIAGAGLPLPVKMQLRLLDSIDESTKHSMEAVQGHAVRALRALTRAYFPVLDGVPTPRLQARIVDKYLGLVEHGDVASSTRGFASALGALPAKLVAFDGAYLDKVLAVLVAATRPDFKVGDEPDAETRRNAIGALVALCLEVGCCDAALPPAKLRNVLECLLAACNDYSTDKRGDVGSWSRIAAMKGLEQIATMAATAAAGTRTGVVLETTPPPPPLSAAAPSAAADGSSSSSSWSGDVLCLGGDLVGRLVCAVLKQLCEKLDNVRSQAGDILQRLVSPDNPLAALVPMRAELATRLGTALPGSAASSAPSLNWALASESYPKMVRCLELAPYHDAVVSGLVLSVGGLTEAVVKSSSNALLHWMRLKRSAKDTVPLARIGSVLLRLLDEYRGVDRVVLPLMKTLELLLASEVLDFLYDPHAALESPPESGAAALNESDAVGFDEEGVCFGVGLLARVNRELQRSTNVVKLFTGLNLGLSLLHFDDHGGGGGVAAGGMRLVLELLGHKYPRVRKHAAEQFYHKLLIDDTLVAGEVYELVLEQLGATVWDADLASVRGERDTIARAVGIELAQHTNTKPHKPKPKKSDALDSYQHLINEVGY